MSPYEGMAKFLYDQTNAFAGSAIGIIANSTSISDYDATKQRPTPGPYVKREGPPPEKYLTKLEEIDQSWVHKYFKDIVVGIKINAADSIKQKNKEHQEARVFEDNDGDLIEENELLVERPSYSYIDALHWKEKLPYLLRRLHDKSKACGIGMLSLLIAYEKVQRENPGKDPKPSQVLEKGVYKMDKSGHLRERVYMNKGPFHDHAMRWIRGDSDHADKYLDDAMSLLDICEKLGIDIRKEDPFEYQEEYIQSLTVLYVTKNRDFVSTPHRSLNTQVLKELRSMNLSDYNKSISKTTVTDWSQIKKDKMQKFLDSTNKKIDRNSNMETQVLIFMTLLNRNEIRIDQKRTRDGFYLNKDNTPTVVDVTEICKDPVPDSAKVFAMVHSSGYLVLVTNTRNMFYLDMETAIEYLRDLRNNRLYKDKRYGSNQKFGRWEETLI